MLFGLQASSASAQNARTAAASSATPRSAIAHTNPTRLATGGYAAEQPVANPKRFFIEFRGRNAASYGHLYILYGEVNANNEIIRSDIAGFHPAGDRNDCENCSVFNWTIGHLVPVPGEMGASDGDLEEKYVTARYRIMLDEAEYSRLAAYIARRKQEKKYWNALWNNCVGFGKEVAEFMGLKQPIFFWLEPKDFVEQLRNLNGGHPQEALRDAPSSPPVAVAAKPVMRAVTSPAPRKPKKTPVPVAHIKPSQTAAATSSTQR